MRIILLTGQSGTGKTSIGAELAKNSDKYNFIHSYTDRPMRSSEEWGHTFVDSGFMDLLLQRNDIVAKTQIKEKRYCTIESQFDINKVNIYTVDLQGVVDTMQAFPYADVMTILIKRDSNDVSEERVERDIAVPIREQVDFVIDNNSTIQSAAKTIDVLVNAGLFRKPSHINTDTIEERLEYIYEQRRYLFKIEESLEEQRWYRDKPLYNQLIQYIRNNIDSEFDIEIHPHTEPVWDDDNCVFPVIAWFKEEDAEPVDAFRLNDILSKLTYEFCDKNDCIDFSFRVYIDCEWIGCRNEQR